MTESNELSPHQLEALRAGARCGDKFRTAEVGQHYRAHSYNVLVKLEEKGMVSRSIEVNIGAGGQYLYFELTEAGRRRVEQEAERWAEVVGQSPEEAIVSFVDQGTVGISKFICCCGEALIGYDDDRAMPRAIRPDEEPDTVDRSRAIVCDGCGSEWLPVERDLTWRRL